MTDSTLKPHSEVTRLVAENVLLLDEVAQLLAESHDLLHLVKPNLLVIYQAKLGPWELQRLQAEVALARTKRQIQMVQASLNHGEKPDLTLIESKLEQEFAAWMKKIEEEAARIQSAEIRLKSVMSPDDQRELKKLYYALVKKLHPDLNPDQTEDQKRLWHRVQVAYEAGNFDELQALTLLVEKPGETQADESSLEQLNRKNEKLRKLITELLAQIEDTQKQPPFSMREQLKDEAWIAIRRSEIESNIKELDSQRDALGLQLKMMLSKNANGTEFGSN